MLFQFKEEGPLMSFCPLKLLYPLALLSREVALVLPGPGGNLYI